MYKRKKRTATPKHRWDERKYVKALQKVEAAAESLVSGHPYQRVNLSRLVEHLERVLDKVPFEE